MFDGGAFDAEAVGSAASWKRALRRYDEANDGSGADDTDGGHAGAHDDHAHDHSHPPEVYGIDSFAYERARPFGPDALLGVLRDLPDGIVRAKGWLHVAGRITRCGSRVRDRKRTSISPADGWPPSTVSRASATATPASRRGTSGGTIGGRSWCSFAMSTKGRCATGSMTARPPEASDRHTVSASAENPFPGETKTELRL